ncbi:hypothetical protein ACFFHM_02435 [Halalkalibacter kiskunsagensis]|uniref:Uncharacterized protein n=1 Tax=Halalkalibacter kiskunsagensis TaxID=1548599 RepID=A0ABV6KC54_9BACI
MPADVIKDGQVVNAELLLTILEECLSEWDLKRQYVQFCVADGQVIIRTLKLMLQHQMTSKRAAISRYRGDLIAAM